MQSQQTLLDNPESVYCELLGHQNSSIIKESELPLVMLHGWGHSSRDLYPLGERLADSRPVLLIDLPGFGKSAPPSDAWGSEEYAKCITERIAEIGYSEFHLLGHSVGGRIALQVALHFPSRVRKLVLINSSGIPAKLSPGRTAKRKALRWSAITLKKVDQIFGSNLFKGWFAPKFGSRDYQQSGVLRSTLVRMVNEDLSPLLSKIQAPTLLIWGDRDTETPLNVGKRMHTLLKNSSLLVLEGRDHEPFRDVGSHLLAYHILPFLTEAKP